MTERDAKPRICVTVDPHWMHRLGLDWFTYRRLVRQAGGTPYPVKQYTSAVESSSDGGPPSRGADFDGLLLGGGANVDDSAYASMSVGVDSTSSRDRFEWDLIQQAISRGRPILGICRGCQLLNVACGGTLKSLPSRERHGEWMSCYKHPVAIKRNSRLHSILGTTRLRGLRSLHRQVIDRPGREVRIVARGPRGIVEAIECALGDDRQLWCIGVQWHPELVAWGRSDQNLMTAFVEASRQTAPARQAS